MTFNFQNLILFKGFVGVDYFQFLLSNCQLRCQLCLKSTSLTFVVIDIDCIKVKEIKGKN